MYSEEEKKLTKELNTTGIVPLRTRVLIKLDTFSDRTPGGIIKPETAKKLSHYRGIVIALGSYARQEELEEEPEYIRVGERVEFREYDGIDIIDPDKSSEDKFRMIEYTDIISKIVDDSI